MSDRFERSLEALAAESVAAEAALRATSSDGFGRPTRCPAWDVRGLAGHMLRDVDRVPEYLAAPAPAQADTDAASYFTSYDPADAPDVAARSRPRGARGWSSRAGRARVGSSRCSGVRGSGWTITSTRACWNSRCTGWILPTPSASTRG